MASKVYQAVGFGVIGLALVVMAVGIMNESEQGEEYVAQGTLRGEALLRSQAAKLDATRAAKKRGHGLDVVDNMVSNWSVDEDKEEEKADLKQLDKGLALTPKQMGFTTYDKHGNPELNLVQQDDGVWTPAGQPGLSQQLKQAHHDEEQQQSKHDGLKGNSVLSSAGLADDTPKDDDDFGELELLQDEEDDWQPQGQPGLNAAMQQAKTKAEQEQMKIDGLKGNDVLSSTGMASAGNENTEDDSTDIGDIFGDDTDNEQLVQEWKPSGQHLEGTPEEAAEKEEKQEAADLVPYRTHEEDDGFGDKKKAVEQTDILGAVGLDSLKGHEEDETEKLGVINTDDIQLVQGNGAKKIAKAVEKLKAGKKAKVSKKEAKTAKTVTKKVAGFSKSKTTTKKTAPSKRLLKNVLFLKVYATLVADEVEDNAKHLGALGTLLKAMAVDSKKQNAVQQYVAAMKSMAKTANRGFPKYTLKHVAKAMVGKGLVVMAPVAFRSGVYVRLDGKDLGLQESYPLLGKLAVSVNTFVTAMAKMKKKITIDLRNKAAQHFSLADFKRIFQATCVDTTNTAANFKACAKMSKAKCGAAKSCKWVGAWKGDIAPEVLTSLNAN